MLRAIPLDDVRRLCAGQVIVDLCSVVKELLENALDAGATNVGTKLCVVRRCARMASCRGFGDCERRLSAICLIPWAGAC